MMANTGLVVNENVKHLSWLIGKWKCVSGKGKYPTIKDFAYGEELEFSSVGQPNLQYSAYAWKIETNKPMHREVGFLKVQPGTNKVALVLAHNIGTSEIEEGEVNGESMITETRTFNRVSFNKPPEVQKVHREFTKDGSNLTQIVSMQTQETSMTEHLRAVYQKM